MAPVHRFDMALAEASHPSSAPGTRSLEAGEASEPPGEAARDAPKPTTRGAAVFDELPLTGCVVAVTADRRREDLAALLRRRGAKVVETPTLRLVPLDNDASLRKATAACLDAPLDYAVATTGSGWRGWMAAADSW